MLAHHFNSAHQRVCYPLVDVLAAVELPGGGVDWGRRVLCRVLDSRIGGAVHREPGLQLVHMTLR